MTGRRRSRRKRAEAVATLPAASRATTGIAISGPGPSGTATTWKAPLLTRASSPPTVTLTGLASTTPPLTSTAAAASVAPASGRRTLTCGGTVSMANETATDPVRPASSLIAASSRCRPSASACSDFSSATARLGPTANQPVRSIPSIVTRNEARSSAPSSS
jgi:hypothetical protein